MCIIEHDIFEEILKDNGNEQDDVAEEENVLFESDARGQQKRMNIANRM